MRMFEFERYFYYSYAHRVIRASSFKEPPPSGAGGSFLCSHQI